MRWCWRVLALGWALSMSLSPLSWSAEPEPTATTAPVLSSRDAYIARLIAGLASPDYQTRQRSARALRSVGRQAYGALVVAARSPLPAVRTQARAIIKDMPWQVREAPPEIQTILRPGRTIKVLEALAQRNDDVSRDALLQILIDETNPKMQWAIAGLIRQRRMPLAFARRMEQAIDLAQAPQAVALGWALRLTDYHKLISLFERAVEGERSAPTENNGELAIVFRALVQYYESGGHPDQAIDMLRVMNARMPDEFVFDDNSSTAIEHLFAIHAQFGPQPGFATDVAENASLLTQPKMIYAMGKVAAWFGLPAEPMYLVAFEANRGNLKGRQETASFLIARGWDDLAERELLTTLAGGEAPNSLNVINAQIRLGMLVARRDDHAAAAKYKQAALDALARIEGAAILRRGEQTLAGDDVQRSLSIEIHWHLARDAATRKDAAALKVQAKQLIAFRSTAQSIANDVVPALKEIGERDLAGQLFKLALDSAEAELKVQFEDQNANEKNSIAWLCARCDEQLPRALELAEQAVRDQPDNPAFLDTLAEVHFRLGHIDQAIEFESQALELWPADKFMSSQLERYRKAAAAPKK